MSNNYGPVWTVNSDEAGGAIIMLMAIVCIPVAPLMYLGYYIGDTILNMNIAKWGLTGLFFLLGYFTIRWLSSNKGTLAAFLFVVTEYIILDVIITQHEGKDELYSVTIIKALVSWAVSNT